MTVALFLPVESAKGALAFAAGIETGRIPCLREYLDEHLARENFAKYPGGISKLLGIFRVENGAAVRVAEGAQRVGPGAFAGDQRGNDVSRSLGFPLAGGAGLNGTVLAPTASMTDRRDGGCVSGNPITEGADGWNGPLPAIGSSFGDSSFGDQEGRHVA